MQYDNYQATEAPMIHKTGNNNQHIGANTQPGYHHSSEKAINPPTNPPPPPFSIKNIISHT
jgi:hypothetical protein